MKPRYFRFQSPELYRWLWVCIAGLIIQMYLNTGTLSAYAATLEKPALYNGYLVNYDWPQYVANYNFITGENHTVWEHGYVLRRMLLYVMGYPLLKLLGFYAGSMLTILIFLLVSMFAFFRFVEKEFGNYATKTSMLLLCSYTGIMYWIGSPFAQNLILPICLWIYMLLYQMEQRNLGSKILSLFTIGVLFTGYDLLPLFMPGIFLFILFHKAFSRNQKLVLIPMALLAFALPQLLIKLWLTLRGYNNNSGNDEAYSIILVAYRHLFDDLPAWYIRIKNVPETLVNCYFQSNFYVLPILFLVSWGFGRYYIKIKMNLLERCLLFSVLFLFLFNNMAPPYEGEWQMWGDWLARIYQGVFIVYLLYIIRLSAHVYTSGRMTLFFKVCIAFATFTNFVINTGGLYASPLTAAIYAAFYKHGTPKSYTHNVLYYGARPLGFPVHYESEIKD